METSSKPWAEVVVLGCEPGIDSGGPRIGCASEAVAEQVREAYEENDATYERVVNRLCDQGLAEYLG